MTSGGRVLLAATWLVAGGRVTAIHLVTNPDKLVVISAGRTLPPCVRTLWKHAAPVKTMS